MDVASFHVLLFLLLWNVVTNLIILLVVLILLSNRSKPEQEQEHPHWTGPSGSHLQPMSLEELKKALILQSIVSKKPEDKPNTPHETGGQYL